MSFILDALKKSESERQRQSGPALFEVKVAPPRNRFAIWAVGLGGLLAINLVVVGWMLWRGGSSRAASAATVTATPPLAAASAPRTAAEPIEAGPRVAGTQPHSAPVIAPPTAPATTQAGAAATTETAAPPSSPGPDAAGSAADDVSPDDLAPAVEPPPRNSQSDGVVRATESGLPTYQDAEAQPGAGIPSLRLDLHVYSPQPDQRFVFLNMMKLHEGDTLPKGVRVERITPDGVILSYQGKRFVLLRQ